MLDERVRKLETRYWEIDIKKKATKSTPKVSRKKNPPKKPKPKRTAETAQDRAGMYALVGFFFQLLGSAAEVCKLVEGGEDPNAWLLLEEFGQDAAILPMAPDPRNPELIQYKYSKQGILLQPNEMVKILEKFRDSITSAEIQFEECEFKLVTNRGESPILEQWTAARGNLEELERRIDESSKSPDAKNLAKLFSKLKIEESTIESLRQQLDEAAARFGVLDNEVDQRVDEVVGMLMKRAAGEGSSRITRRDLVAKLTGDGRSWELDSKASIETQRICIEEHKKRSTSGANTIPRSVCKEILRSAFSNRITLVSGNGGCGKSVAVADALLEGLSSEGAPPGFCVLLEPTLSRPSELGNLIARWRNLDPSEDGENMQQSLNRLRRSSNLMPLLVICIDAIDERIGLPSRPLSSFVDRLLALEPRNNNSNGTPTVSVVLTCRNQSELFELSPSGLGYPDRANHVYVANFDEDEIMQVIRESSLSPIIQERLLNSHDTEAGEQIAPECFRILQHPIVWRIFSSLDDIAIQNRCLDSLQGMKEIGPKFLMWFDKKARDRNPCLQPNEVQVALKAVAVNFRFKNLPVASYVEDWQKPCVSVGISHACSKSLFLESLSAGMIKEEQQAGKTWQWEHRWFLDFLSSEGDNNG